MWLGYTAKLPVDLDGWFLLVSLACRHLLEGLDAVADPQDCHLTAAKHTRVTAAAA